MLAELNIMVGGEAGQGVQSVGKILVALMGKSGKCVFADQDYESRVRGGHNFFRIRAHEDTILAFNTKLNLLIALNRETIELHKHELSDNGIIITDKEQTKTRTDHVGLINIPLVRLAQNVTQDMIVANTVAIGATTRILGLTFEALEQVLKRQFSDHSSRIIESNLAAAKQGYDYVKTQSYDNILRMNVTDSNRKKQIVLNGNEALAIGALVAGCRFIAGYPMSPATSILEYIADKSRKYDVTAIHAEDEIAAINMAIGAAFAGHRSMVATSGGGFCLMVEGLSLAGMTETPVVIVIAQRPGPATGLPTRTEQGDLEFALHAGHGEFPRLVLAPATVEEAFYMTVEAFNMAEKYQTPVLILTDHHLASSYTTISRFNLRDVDIDRGELILRETAKEIGDYKRHKITESGISPRLLPLQSKALVVTDSDEHDEFGHPIEDAETRNQQNLKRLRKLNSTKPEIGDPIVNINPDAEYTLVGWGSTFGAIQEAREVLNNDGLTTNLLHLGRLWPFPSEKVFSALNGKTRIIVVENNATAQLGRLIRRETGVEANGNILKFDGRPFSPKYIVDRVKKAEF